MGSFQIPNIWPWTNAVKIITFDPDKVQAVNEKTSYTFFNEFILRNIRQSTYLLIACFAVLFSFPANEDILGHASDEYKWWVKWAAIIIFRDQFITILFYQFWHVLLYKSKYAKKMQKLKFNPDYPSEKQWSHDRFWSLSGTLISSFFELYFIYFYKSNPHLLQTTFWNKQWYFSLFWIFFIRYWRVVHFYFYHRACHPWISPKLNSKWKQYDIGCFLYKHVHSLHHKSYNPGPWSGLSMHPIEHLMYYTTMFVPICFGIPQHPVMILMNKFDASISPLPGHDGYDEPAGASYFHWLHHAHYQCNYGTCLVPLDKLFGSFEDGTTFRKKKQFDSKKDFHIQ